MGETANVLTWRKALAAVVVCVGTMVLHRSRLDPFGDPVAFIVFGIVCGGLRVGPVITGVALFLGTVFYAWTLPEPEQPVAAGIVLFYWFFYAFSFAVITTVSYFGGVWVRARMEAALDERQ